MASTIIPARVHRRTRLSQGMVNRNVHWPMDCREYCGRFLASVFVTAFNGFCLPVAPVDIVLKYRESKYVVKSSRWRGTT